MLVAILFLLKTQEQKTKMRPPNVLYEVILTWDGKSGDDLDLWVQSASGHLVGFNRREGGHGSLVSLDHDALGVRNNLCSAPLLLLLDRFLVLRRRPFLFVFVCKFLIDFLCVFVCLTSFHLRKNNLRV